MSENENKNYIVILLNLELDWQLLSFVFFANIAYLFFISQFTFDAPLSKWKKRLL